MRKGKCHKCGKNIWNGIPEEEMKKTDFDTSEFINKMKSEGYFFWVIKQRLLGHGETLMKFL